MLGFLAAMSRLMVNGWYMTGYFIFALLTGMVVSALIGNVVEWRTGQVAKLSAPHVIPERIVKSLLLVASAGPYLLVNEALQLARPVHRGLIVFAILAALTWALASGILWLEILIRLSHN